MRITPEQKAVILEELYNRILNKISRCKYKKLIVDHITNNRTKQLVLNKHITLLYLTNEKIYFLYITSIPELYTTYNNYNRIVNNNNKQTIEQIKQNNRTNI